jgi:hypothetical protein
VLDWITVVIELVGIVILLTWIVIPIREFRQILRAVKSKPAPGDPLDPSSGFPVEPGRGPARGDGPGR